MMNITRSEREISQAQRIIQKIRAKVQSEYDAKEQVMRE